MQFKRFPPIKKDNVIFVWFDVISHFSLHRFKNEIIVMREIKNVSLKC